MKSINGFFGVYRFLSNFEYADVVMDNFVYPTTEHAYQAAKTFSEDEKYLILTCGEPKIAKRLGMVVTMRKDWDSIKYDVMLDLNRQKFKNHKHLKDKLLATGDAYLEETNTWGDTYWGVCRDIGQNNLGKILMQIRSEL